MAGREFLNAESHYWTHTRIIELKAFFPLKIDPIPVYRRKETSLQVWNPEQTPVILNQPEGSLLTFEMELELLISQYPLFLFHTIQELP